MRRDAFHLLLGLLVALLLAMGASLLLPGSLQPTAEPHPDVPSLLRSSSGGATRPEAIWMGYVMGLLILAIMGTCAWIGLRQSTASHPLPRRMAVGFVVYGLVFTALTVSYARYAVSRGGAFLGGFPLPTAWMVYGIWLFPLLLVALYALSFDRGVLSPEDIARFEDLVKERRERDGAA